MNRTDIINLVKVKLEEYSPFEEPKSLIALPHNNSKPIDSYIENELHTAYNEVLLSVPHYMFVNEISDISITITTDTSLPLVEGQIVVKDNVGYLPIPYDFLRLHTVSFDNWGRDVNSHILTTHPTYALQRNKYTRGKTERPVIAINNDQFEIYSVMPNAACTCFSYVKRQYSNCNLFNDHLADLIATRCAISILQIFEQINIAKSLSEDYTAKLQNLSIQ